MAASLPEDVRDELELLEGAHGPAIGLVGPAGGGPHLLTVADRSLVEHPPYSAAEAALHEVETWLLQESLLLPVLGDGFGEYVTYVHDSQQALDMVRSLMGTVY